MKKFKVGNVLRLSESNDFASEAGDIIKIVGVLSQPVAGCEYITIRGCKGRLGLFSITSEFASSLELLTGKEIGEAIRKWDADHAKKEPEYKEVKRHARVGEYIKAIHDDELDRFEKGDILEVTDDCHESDVWRDRAVGYNNTLYVIRDEEYVVLDGYKPEKKGKRSYTTEQIEQARKLCGEMIVEAFDEGKRFAFHFYDKFNGGWEGDCEENEAKADFNSLDGTEATGVAKCSDHDEYNVWVGRCVALCKALHKPIPTFIMGD